MDAATAQSQGFSVGQRVRILTAASTSAQTFTITGIAQFGTADNLAGQTLAAFTLPTAQRLLGETGLFDFIDVVATPGADKAAVQRSIARALPSDAEVVTGQTIIDEDANAVSQALSFLNTALLIFALIALFVGAFTIYNTFSIIVGQRTRELALLRVVGASRGQVLALGSDRGRGRGARLVRDRGWPRRGRRHRARGAAERFRHHAADRAADVRAADRDRRARRRHAGDGRLGDRAGQERRADPAGGGAHRPPVRRRRGRRDQASAHFGYGAHRIRASRCSPSGWRSPSSRWSASARSASSSASPCSPPRSRGRCPACSGGRWPRCSAPRDGSGGRTPCAARAAPPRRPPRSWSGSPWSPRSRCSAHRCRRAPPAAWTRRSAPTSWSPPTAADSSATRCRRRRPPCPGSPPPRPSTGTSSSSGPPWRRSPG